VDELIEALRREALAASRKRSAAISGYCLVTEWVKTVRPKWSPAKNGQTLVSCTIPNVATHQDGGPAGIRTQNQGIMSPLH
jgi:hypothetical protein